MKAKEYKDKQVVFHSDAESVNVEEGVVRRVKAYTKDLMCVENEFRTGAVGSLHFHPHTQITYVVSGKFKFTIGDKEYQVTAGDTLLKTDGIVHGCVALEGGILLDIFNPMREEFVE